MLARPGLADIAPALLEEAGVMAGRPFAGRSLLPLLRGETPDDWPDHDRAGGVRPTGNVPCGPVPVTPVYGGRPPAFVPVHLHVNVYAPVTPRTHAREQGRTRERRSAWRPRQGSNLRPSD